jgi:hypothetical protein
MCNAEGTAVYFAQFHSSSCPHTYVFPCPGGLVDPVAAIGQNRLFSAFFRRIICELISALSTKNQFCRLSCRRGPVWREALGGTSRDARTGSSMADLSWVAQCVMQPLRMGLPAPSAHWKRIDYRDLTLSTMLSALVDSFRASCRLNLKPTNSRGHSTCTDTRA